MSNPQVDLGRSFRGTKENESKVHSVQAGKQEVKPLDVVVSIVASGLCGTDLHYIKGGKVGLGHEGAGFVSQVGSAVEEFKQGDRVGWGYVHGSDLTCDACVRGKDTFCPNAKLFGNSNTQQGSIGDTYVIDSRFLHKIPDNLSLVNAAPLQCAGATVFGAILTAGVQPVDRIGVLGIGGLGHLCLQYLSKMGCDVVAFSGTDSKKEEATKLGANEFVAAKDGGLAKLTAPVKHLFITTSAQPNWEEYLDPKVLATGGTIVPLSVSGDPFHLEKYQQIVGRELKIQGSLVASRPIHRQMLTFTARHGIKPMVEELPLTDEGVQQGIDRLQKGDVRYRFVFVHPENKDPAPPKAAARF